MYGHIHTYICVYILPPIGLVSLLNPGTITSFLLSHWSEQPPAQVLFKQCLFLSQLTLDLFHLTQLIQTLEVSTFNLASQSNDCGLNRKC